MGSVFTDYVAGLSPEIAPDPATFERTLRALRQALVREMHRRGLWNAPPRYLGVYGGNHWSEGDLLSELVFACYEFIFVRRLPGLRRQSATRSSIDGLIFLNVRHFLHEAQRRHDPLGYRIFEVVHGAVAGLVDDATLHVLEGDPKIRNQTVLGFLPWADPEPVGLDEDRIRSWNDELMPGLVTAWRREPVVEAVARRIAGLVEERIPAFRFRDLVDPLKDDARARWLAILFQGAAGERSDEDGDDGEPLPAFREEPRHPYEERQSLLVLLACIARSIERSGGDPRARAYLRRLFDFLRCWSAALEEGPAAGPPPSDKRLGELLGIPRGRIKKLKATLGEVTSACRRQVDAGPASPRVATTHPRPLEAAAAAAEGATTMDLEKRGEKLRQRTREALRRELSEAPAAGGGPRPGDSYVFGHLEPGIEWLVIDRRADGRWQLVPVDTLPLVGSRDLELDEAGGEPLVVRGGLAVGVEGAALERGIRTRRLTAATADNIGRRLAAAGTGTATMLEEEVDSDSEYRAWRSRLAAAGRSLAQSGDRAAAGGATVSALGTRHRSGLRRRPPRRRPLAAYALAAVFAFAALGLTIYSARLRQQLAEAGGPILIASHQAEEIRLGGRERGLEIRLRPVDERYTLVYLVFRDVPAYPLYRLRLLDPGTGEVRWHRDLPTLEEHLLVLPAGSRAPTGRPAVGRLELLGVAADGRVEVLDQRLLTVAADGEL